MSGKNRIWPPLTILETRDPSPDTGEPSEGTCVEGGRPNIRSGTLLILLSSVSIVWLPLLLGARRTMKIDGCLWVLRAGGDVISVGERWGTLGHH